MKKNTKHILWAIGAMIAAFVGYSVYEFFKTAKQNFSPSALWSFMTGKISQFFDTLTGGFSSTPSAINVATQQAQSIGVNTNTPTGQSLAADVAAGAVDPGLNTTGILNPDGTVINAPGTSIFATSPIATAAPVTATPDDSSPFLNLVP